MGHRSMMEVIPYSIKLKYNSVCAIYQQKIDPKGPYVEPAWVWAQRVQTQVGSPSLGLLGLGPKGPNPPGPEPSPYNTSSQDSQSLKILI